jgi:hypothetical protein
MKTERNKPRMLNLEKYERHVKVFDPQVTRKLAETKK